MNRKEKYNPRQLDEIDFRELMLTNEEILMGICHDAGYRSVVLDYLLKKGDVRNLSVALSILPSLSEVPVEKVADVFNGLKRGYEKKKRDSRRKYSKLESVAEKNRGDHWRRDAMDAGRRINELGEWAERYGLKKIGRKYVPVSTEVQ